MVDGRIFALSFYPTNTFDKLIFFSYFVFCMNSEEKQDKLDGEWIVRQYDNSGDNYLKTFNFVFKDFSEVVGYILKVEQVKALSWDYEDGAWISNGEYAEHSYEVYNRVEVYVFKK